MEESKLSVLKQIETTIAHLKLEGPNSLRIKIKEIKTIIKQKKTKITNNIYVSSIF
jgi:hypothetical protein